MSIANNARRNGAANLNAGVIAGLREAADFLEANPGLPSFNGFLMYHAWGANSREELTAVARALGDSAEETATAHEVRIAGAFSGVKVHAYAQPAKLGASPVPRPVDYEPIIQPCPNCRGEGGHRSFTPGSKMPDPQTAVTCDVCEGSGRAAA